ncbi:MAG TPA: PEGA domain-containing protein [Candidatus Kapabacteria bacterium]|jgi:hypothetical protein|nr:PEGA domain-containing protein [Candidatus Kapabacteria bacterium]
MKQFSSLCKVIATLLISIFLVTGCGLIFHGTKDPVNFTSEPEKCQVYINGIFMGTTPLMLELKSNKTYIVEFRKDGYERKVFNLTNSVNGGYIFLDVLFGLWPIVIDAATGGWYTLDYDHIHSNLELEK